MSQIHQTQEGIMVGVCNKQEWMLPWWFFHLRKYNSYPICFVNFGMSKKGKKWAQERGLYAELDIKTNFVKMKKDVHPSYWQEWKKDIKGNIWNARKKWFLKPFAMLKTPFTKTIWLDNDCEVKCELQEVFTQMKKDKIVAARDLKSMDRDDTKPITYNSGVLGFHVNHPLLEQWKDICYNNNDRFLGDQDAFSFLLHRQPYHLVELKQNYNFFPHVYDTDNNLLQQIDGGIKIIHWGGSVGKNNILKQILAMPAMSFYDFKELF